MIRRSASIPRGGSGDVCIRRASDSRYSHIGQEMKAKAIELTHLLQKDTIKLVGIQGTLGVSAIAIHEPPSDAIVIPIVHKDLGRSYGLSHNVSAKGLDICGHQKASDLVFAVHVSVNVILTSIINKVVYDFFGCGIGI